MTGMTVLFAGIYMAPTIVACSRGSKRQSGITVLNVLLGWTFIGWIAALVWAIESETT